MIGAVFKSKLSLTVYSKLFDKDMVQDQALVTTAGVAGHQVALVRQGSGGPL